MIDKFEALQLAKQLGLQNSTIEKDYVLGWRLIGEPILDCLTMRFAMILSRFCNLRRGPYCINMAEEQRAKGGQKHAKIMLRNQG